MPASEAQIAASRANGCKSRGPVTPEGKAVSRRNALQHGMAGEGVVLPPAEDAEVARRSAAMLDEFRPASEMGRYLVERMARLTVRVELCDQQERAATAARVRRAGTDFDDARRAEVEALVLQLAEDPAPALRRLMAMPEGVDRLREILAAMKSDLLDGPRPRWHQVSRDRLSLLVGRPGAARVAALTTTLYAVDVDGSVERARSELAAIIDGQVARLGEARRAIDEQPIAADRAGAPARALFDPSREASLARRYEAAADRGVYRALHELRRVEAEVAEAEAGRVASPEVREPAAPSGSFGAGEPGAAEGVARDPRPAPPAAPGPRTHQDPMIGAGVTGLRSGVMAGSGPA
jgi:hypothetical protein